MKIILKLAFFFVLSLFLISNIQGQERKYSISTAAGKLNVSSIAGEIDCVIKLGGKVIRTFECDYSPIVLKHIKQPILLFDEIIVFQEQTSAQSCEGLDVFFLGLNRGGTYKFSDSIEYCGGPRPIVTISGEKITITFPAFKAFSGGLIRKQVWVYENGEIRQIKQNQRRKKR